MVVVDVIKSFRCPDSSATQTKVPLGKSMVAVRYFQNPACSN